MKKAYERTQANRMIPLLASISREVRDRKRSIKRKERLLGRMRSAAAELCEVLGLQAELAGHKRELRHAEEELDRLGCALNDSPTRTVLIPGRNGALEDGYRWRLGESLVSES